MADRSAAGELSQPVGFPGGPSRSVGQIVHRGSGTSQRRRLGELAARDARRNQDQGLCGRGYLSTGREDSRPLGDGVAEFPNAWIKTKIGLRQFRLRGLAKVIMETLWACLTYNIQQWIRLRWRELLVLRTV